MSSQDHTRDFDQFWAVWPLKVAKKAAQQAWAKTAKDRPPNDVLLARVHAYIENRQRKIAAKEFCPEFAHPATWLNGERWNDEFPWESQLQTAWHETASGIVAKGAEFGLAPDQFANFPTFKAAVVDAVKRGARGANVVTMARRRA